MVVWLYTCVSQQYNRDLAKVFDSVQVDLQGITLLEQAGRDNLINFANSGIGQIDFQVYLTEVSCVHLWLCLCWMARCTLFTSFMSCAQKALHSAYMRIHSVKIISIILLILFFLFNVKYFECNHNIFQFC